LLPSYFLIYLFISSDFHRFFLSLGEYRIAILALDYKFRLLKVSFKSFFTNKRKTTIIVSATIMANAKRIISMIFSII